jgi:hypothetical protein
MPRVLASIQGAVSEVNEAHRPDNGQSAAALELATLLALRRILNEVDSPQNQLV